VRTPCACAVTAGQLLWDMPRCHAKLKSLGVYSLEQNCFVTLAWDSQRRPGARRGKRKRIRAPASLRGLVYIWSLVSRTRGTRQQALCNLPTRT
jgi:hypothetical protein